MTNVSESKAKIGNSSSLAKLGFNDIKVAREQTRQNRMLKAAIVAALCTAPVSVWLFFGSPIPTVDPFLLTIIIFFCLLGTVAVLQTRGTGASPHTRLSPEQISLGFDDIQGLGPVKKEIIESLDLFLASKTFRKEMGGTSRKGLLMEGPPGTGKTLTAKAMAAESGVPFMFIPSTAFQSMWSGGSARKIRTAFKEARKIARTEGGVIMFLEEIDAIGGARSGMSSSMTSSMTANQSENLCCGGLTGLPVINQSNPQNMVQNQMISTEGSGGVVNELLIQMQSFDEPYGFRKHSDKFIGWVNSYLPDTKRIKLKGVEPANILIIAATNRADNLDPALLRPGRFDRRISFDLPGKSGRRELIDYFLSKKAHNEELESDEVRDALAAITTGYSPASIENLFDEALIMAVSRDSKEMSWRDVEHARMLVTVGVGQPVEYTEFEKKLIASHEAGHAVTAWLTAPQRRLEILTIIKRKNALGMLAHGDVEDVYTRQRKEMLSLIQIAMGGQVAEELLFGDISTGPAGDLLYATNVAAQMVGSAGMGRSLISMDAAGGGMMDSGLVSRVLSSGHTRAEVEEILNLAKESVTELLQNNIKHVEALRDALLERNELIGSEITDVLEAVGPRGKVIPLTINSEKVSS